MVCCCWCFSEEHVRESVVTDHPPVPPPKNPNQSPKQPKPASGDPGGAVTFNIHGNEIRDNKADDVGIRKFGNKVNDVSNGTDKQNGGCNGNKQQGDGDTIRFNLENNKIHGNEAKNVGVSEFGNNCGGAGSGVGEHPIPNRPNPPSNNGGGGEHRAGADPNRKNFEFKGTEVTNNKGEALGFSKFGNNKGNGAGKQNGSHNNPSFGFQDTKFHGNDGKTVGFSDFGNQN